MVKLSLLQPGKPWKKDSIRHLMPSYQVTACLMALHRLVSDAFSMLNIDGYPVQARVWATSVSSLEPKPFPPDSASHGFCRHVKTDHNAVL